MESTDNICTALFANSDLNLSLKIMFYVLKFSTHFSFDTPLQNHNHEKHDNHENSTIDLFNVQNIYVNENKLPSPNNTPLHTQNP